MSVTMQYRAVVTCDTCGKRVATESIDYPPSTMIPTDWIQGAPPGRTSQMEFCSSACLAAWKPPVLPWNEPIPEDMKMAETHEEVAQ